MRKAVLLGLIAFLTLLADYASKEAAFRTIEARSGRALELVPGVLWVRARTNTGAAFSLLADAQHGNWLLLVVSFLLVPVLIWLYFTRYRTAPVWAFACVVGGALGNTVDRILFGAVRDFLDLRFWPATFNVADVGISLGVAVLLIWSLRGTRHHEGRGSPAAGQPPLSG